MSAFSLLPPFSSTIHAYMKKKLWCRPSAQENPTEGKRVFIEKCTFAQKTGIHEEEGRMVVLQK